MSNIRKHAVEQTSVLHLHDANDDPMYAEGDGGKPDKSKPMTVTLYGPGSKQHARATAAQNNRMVDQLKRKGKTSQTAEQRRDEQAQFLSACTVRFDNVTYETDTGAKLEGDALAKAIYSDPEIGFIVDQVAKHLGDWSNFSMPSTKTSATS